MLFLTRISFVKESLVIDWGFQCSVIFLDAICTFFTLSSTLLIFDICNHGLIKGKGSVMVSGTFRGSIYAAKGIFVSVCMYSNKLGKLFDNMPT